MIDFVICPKCSKGPKDNSQEKVEKFLREHATHFELNQHPRIIGMLSSPSFLKKKRVAIRFVEEPKVIVECRYKKCSNYNKGYKGFCSKRCKKKYKLRRKK